MSRFENGIYKRLIVLVERHSKESSHTGVDYYGSEIGSEKEWFLKINNLLFRETKEDNLILMAT